MKTKRLSRWIPIIGLILLSFSATTLSAQTTAFTYQGRLNDGASPASGSYDLSFALFSTDSGAGQVGVTITNGATAVSNGLFTVTLDFGNQFPGADRWLEIGVRTNGGGAFTTLSPRQKLTPSPYAIKAGGVNASGITGTISPANIAAGSITSVMLAAGSVGSNQLAASAVTTAALADGAVTSAKMFTSFNLLSTTALTNPTPLASDQFGFAVAALGADKILVGANLDDAGSNNAGAAHLFDTAGNLLVTLTNPTPAADDNFGYAVCAVGPDKLLVGAYQDDTGALNAGSAYLFSTSGALLLTITNPSPAVADIFGFSVTAVGAGNFLIGSAHDNPGGGQFGAAYLYDLAGNMVQAFTNPTPANLDGFGTAVAAVSSDKVLIGASSDDTGASGAGTAYLFNTNGTLLTTFTNPTPVANDAFGTTVASVGTDKVLISAPSDNTGVTDAGAAYLYDLNGNLLTTFTNPAPASGDGFGNTLTAVGTNRVLIGAPTDEGSNAGTAYLFDLSGNLLKTLTDPAPATSDQFGVALAAFDEDRIIVGTLRDDLGVADAGGVFLFTFDTFMPGLIADQVRSGGVTSAGLAPGAAVANLAASGQSAVPSGGIILSSNTTDSNLASAGYVNIGNTSIGERWLRRSGGEQVAPVPRENHSAVWTGSEMIVWGGFDGSFFRSGGRYDPTTGNWTATPLTNAPERRSQHTAVWTGTEMIVWGGTKDSLPRADGGRYDPVANSWQPISTTNTPSGRFNHTAVWTGDRMIVWGGVDGTNYLDTGKMYFPALNIWSNLTTTGAPSARAEHTTVWDGATKMIVWGGFDGATTVSNGATFSLSSLTWSTSAVTLVGAPQARYLHSAVWTGSEMIIWGGNGSSVTNDLTTGARFHLASNVWTALPTSGAASARSAHTVVWTGTEMIIWGGLRNSSVSFPPTRLGVGGRYNRAANAWTTNTFDNEPSGRGAHTAVWTGSEMIVWGGSTANDFLDTGGRYSPADDHWTTTRTTAGYPAISSGERTAVWTGSEMILWGGIDYSSADDASVARYHPVTDTWTTISTNNMPAGRSSGHTAVWSGTEMIVWGGSSLIIPGYGSDFLNTGGRYNPATDIWATMTTNGAPLPRGDHTAVWTGSEMIVWGGKDDLFAYASGGRYSPLSDTWLPTSQTNVPTGGGRFNHSALWTGSEMIVWGGIRGSVDSATGGRYHPGTDTWIQTSMDGVPTARSSHTAIWTGSEMIVWGGEQFSPSKQLNTGGCYEPTTDAWRPISTNTAPTARSGYAAVWTGNEMLVWGGGADNTGGRYNLQNDTWAETTRTGAPSARSSLNAIWTGSEMIIVGGSVLGGAFNDTSSYTPPKAMYLYLKP